MHTYSIMKIRHAQVSVKDSHQIKCIVCMQYLYIVQWFLVLNQRSKRYLHTGSTVCVLHISVNHPHGMQTDILALYCPKIFDHHDFNSQYSKYWILESESSWVGYAFYCESCWWRSSTFLDQYNVFCLISTGLFKKCLQANDQTSNILNCTTKPLQPNFKRVFVRALCHIFFVFSSYSHSSLTFSRSSGTSCLERTEVNCCLLFLCVCMLTFSNAYRTYRKMTGIHLCFNEQWQEFHQGFLI